MSSSNNNNSADIFPAWQENLFCRSEAVLRWLEDTVYQVDTTVPVVDFLLSWRDGKALCAVVSYHRPDLLDYASSLLLEPAQRIELALGATSSVRKRDSVLDLIFLIVGCSCATSVARMADNVGSVCLDRLLSALVQYVV